MIPVGRYLPGVIPAGGKITIRELLQHRSGLANYTGYPSWTDPGRAIAVYQAARRAAFRGLPAPALRTGNAVGLLQRQRMIPPVVRAACGRQVEVCSNRLTETAGPLAGLPFRSQGPFSPAAGCRNRSRRTRMINLHARPRQSASSLRARNRRSRRLRASRTSHAASRPLVSAVAPESAALMRKPGSIVDGFAVTCTGQAISRAVSRALQGRGPRTGGAATPP
jgi:hypothetical protein